MHQNGQPSSKPPAPSLAKTKAKRPQHWSHPSLNSHQVRKVALTAVCDPRSVYAYLWGLSQPALVRERIERALRTCSHEKLVGTMSERAEASRSAEDRDA